MDVTIFQSNSNQVERIEDSTLKKHRQKTWVDGHDAAIKNSIQEELRSVIDLALPILITQMGFSVPSLLLASYIGLHFGSLYLDAYMLGNLTGNLAILSILEGIFGALDTLLPQAYGAGHYSELQVVAIRGFVLCMTILVPIVSILSFLMDDILVTLGEDSDASKYATQYYRIYAFSLPFYALFQTMSNFLTAQSIVSPQVLVILPNCLVIFPICLYALGSRIGFLGTCLSFVLYQAIQTLSLLLYLRWNKPYHPETWKTLDASTWKRSMQSEPLSILLWLAVGGFLASSEWIFWEVLSLMIGTLGALQLSVHTIPTQVLTVTYMIPLSIGIAMSIRIGNILPQSAQRAKKLGFAALAICVIFFSIMACSIYTYRHFIYSTFTTETKVIEGCEQIWIKVTIFSFNMCVLIVNMGIAIGLGQQWIVGKATMIYLWILGLPSIYYFAFVKGGGLNAAWLCLLPLYMALNLTLVIYFVVTDWDDIALNARLREGIESSEVELLSADDVKFGYGTSGSMSNKNTRECSPKINFSHAYLAKSNLETDLRVYYPTNHENVGMNNPINNKKYSLYLEV